MDIIGVMNDKALKGTKKRAAVIEMIVSGDLNCEQIESIQTKIDDKQMATILEAIDIQVEVSALKYSQLSSASSGEPSSEIRKRVIAARQIQENRYREYPGIHCNAQMTDRLLHQYCVMDEETNSTLQLAMERLHLSARAYSRILKVARTIADLEGKENIQMHHIAEAIGYRNLDRGDWAERGI